MTDTEKLAFHAAGQIRDRLWNFSQRNLTVRLPTDYWQDITRLARRIEIAAARGWPAAAQSLRADLARSIDYCRDRMTALYTELEKTPPKAPSLPSLYNEILALYEEFEEVEIDFEEHEIVATTESITLEGIFLGPFEIRLDWEKLGNPSPYRIKALRPNPATANESVTHPHVQAERLCEGEGRTAICSALEEGRLGDFFLLVAQVLRTYGKGSAYVELDDWDGVNCSDCGGSTYESERYYCSRCDATLCDPCARACNGCDSTFCSDCLESCAICEDSFCSSCLTACKNCHEYVCENCLPNSLCEKCHAKLNTPDDADEPVDDEGDSDQCDDDTGEIQTQAEPLAVGV